MGTQVFDVKGAHVVDAVEFFSAEDIEGKWALAR